MFEKSLYDLIRGLRSRKGDERAYILESLKECRNEARSQDGDIKATAILKLIYLEMFGHDMSWASFHVLEVMSSTKFLQKRIGYLAAVQSFTLETDVLMLATNLLKKDLSSSSPFDISLALNGLSHIVSPSLARDLSSDLITKMNHTNPYIRKKAILVMYKCFLQSPELLRTAWPRLREGLNDDDPSVVNATVNVICELARKNPRNYLPLAPQLFGLLTSSKTAGNNWMTIKIIKLFATLTPLEPRLTKKLVPPITNLIKTTPAMSLLYECINGLISGGLLAAMGDTEEAEELASVCVTKLRGFLVEGDSNLKYVGLLAFTKIVSTHAHLVALHQDVILDCIDDMDISIRLRALELVVGMVSSENLQTVVGRLMRQLRPPDASSSAAPHDGGGYDPDDFDSANEDSYTGRPKPARRMGKKKVGAAAAATFIPESYKVGVIKRILEMCSRDMYANVTDFGWYLDVLIQLVRLAPPVTSAAAAAVPGEYYDGGEDDETGGGEDDEESAARKQDVGEDIGYELRNVAVRVKSIRGEAVTMADLLVRRRDGMFPLSGGGGKRVLLHAGWIVGEYASLLPDPSSTLASLLNSYSSLLQPDILAIYIQSIPKVYAIVTGHPGTQWTPFRKSSVLLLTETVVKFLEPHAASPDLEVQERAVEFLELFRLAVEAVAAQPSTTEAGREEGGYYVEVEPPRLLTQAIPAMFSGLELNPVAPRAQRKVPLPPMLDLDVPINKGLHVLISQAESFSLESMMLGGAGVETDNDDEDSKEEAEFWNYYYRKPQAGGGVQGRPSNVPASQLLDSAVGRIGGGGGIASGGPGTYQYQTSTGEESYLDADIVARRRRERSERNRDDPFYIGGGSGAAASPNPLRGEEVDVDSIPVLPLDLGVEDLLVGGGGGVGGGGVGKAGGGVGAGGGAGRKRVEIARDEMLEGESGGEDEGHAPPPPGKGRHGGKNVNKHHHPLLGPAATGLVGFALEESVAEKDERERQRNEVRKARLEVERFRRELERAESAKAEKEREKEKERGGGEGGARKKKKDKKEKKEKRVAQEPMVVDEGGAQPVKKKKKTKKKKAAEGDDSVPPVAEAAETDTEKVKLKAKKTKAAKVSQPQPETQTGDLLSPEAEAPATTPTPLAGEDRGDGGK